MRLGTTESRIHAIAGLVGFGIYFGMSLAAYNSNQPITFEYQLPSGRPMDRGYQIEWDCFRPQTQAGFPKRYGACIIAKDIEDKDLSACLEDNKIKPSRDFFFLTFGEEWDRSILTHCEYLLDQKEQQDL